MIGGILFILVEFQLDMCLDDNVARLFVQILCACVPLLTFLVLTRKWYRAAAKENRKAYFTNLRIYGFLTDLFDFHFYSYDPLSRKFAFDETLIVNNTTRGLAFTDMIPGMRIFLPT
jgi:hypothetical protein